MHENGLDKWNDLDEKELKHIMGYVTHTVGYPIHWKNRQ